MKIILPVAGKGSRFYPQSAVVPKCLLPVRGKLMIEWALSSIWHRTEDVIVIFHADQLPLIAHALRGLLPRAELVEQTEPLQGAAHTVFQANGAWKHHRDVVIVDCDIHALSSYCSQKWTDFRGNGSVLSFSSACPSKSYILEGEGGYVRQIVEKQVVSSRAVGGIYHFRSGMELYQAMEKQIAMNQMVKGEFYVSETVNIYLEKNPQYRHFQAIRFHDIGTPENVRLFEALDDNLI